MAGGRVRRLGAFEIVKDLAAKGAQGKLYVGRVVDDFPGLMPGALVALKVMPDHGDDAVRDYKRLVRRTEALVAAANPGIVRYYGCFATSQGFEDFHVLVMELLHGQTLEERLRANKLGIDADEALRIIRTCANALVTCAQHGLVHRDIKPSNIFLCEDGSAKLIDFEIARQEGASRTTTESGAMRGTVDYMAPDFHPDFRPESGFRGDECSDVFSLTVCFYEMLAGSRPYAAGGAMGEQSMMAFFQRWTKVEGVDVGKALKVETFKIHALAHVQKVIKKGLSPERSGRYQTYREFAEALVGVKVRELVSPQGRYELLRCVGKGGFGVVFRARRKSDGLPVAIKVLLRPEYSERFIREAKTLSRFKDDRLVSFIEYFKIIRATAETHFIVMQFLDGMPGSSLRDRISGASEAHQLIPPREVAEAFRRYAGGLGVLHAAGIVHRDIKPANLYLPKGEPGLASVMDLGVVKTEETHTQGSLPGTLDYMAPEMATGASRGSPAVDIYALGLCLHEALTCHPAFPRLKRGGDGLAEFYRRANSGERPDLSRLDNRPTWKALVAAMIDSDAKRRIQSCDEVLHRLAHIPEIELADPNIERRPGDNDSIASGSEVGLSSLAAADMDSDSTESLLDQVAPVPPQRQPTPTVKEKRQPIRIDLPQKVYGEDKSKEEQPTSPAASLADGDLGKASDGTAHEEVGETHANIIEEARPDVGETRATAATAAASRGELLEALSHKKEPSGEQSSTAKPEAQPKTVEKIGQQPEPKTRNTKKETPKQPAKTATKSKPKEKVDAAPAVIVREEKSHNVWGILAALAIAAAFGIAFYLMHEAKLKEEEPISVTKPDKSPEEPGGTTLHTVATKTPPATTPPPTVATNTPPSPPPNPRRLEAQNILDKATKDLASYQTEVAKLKTTDLDGMRALKAELEKHTTPSAPEFADIDQKLGKIRKDLDILKANLNNKIEDAARTQRRQAALATLDKEKDALTGYQSKLAKLAGTDIVGMRALKAELEKHTTPSAPEFADIDQKLGKIRKDLDILKANLNNKIIAAQKALDDDAARAQRRQAALATLNEEKDALTGYQSKFAKLADADIDGMGALKADLEKHATPSAPEFADIDQKLKEIREGFATLKANLGNKIEVAKKAKEERQAAETNLRADMTRLSDRATKLLGDISVANDLTRARSNANDITNGMQRALDTAKKTPGVTEGQTYSKSREDVGNWTRRLADEMAKRQGELENLRNQYVKAKEAVDRASKAVADLNRDVNGIHDRASYDRAVSSANVLVLPNDPGHVDLDRRLRELRSTLQSLTNSLTAKAAIEVENTGDVTIVVTPSGGDSLRIAPKAKIQLPDLPVWSEIILSASTEGASRNDYDTGTWTIKTLGGGTLTKTPISLKYRGNPTIRVINENDFAVVAKLGGELKEVAANGNVEFTGKPRQSTTVSFSFGNEYEITKGVVSRTLAFGNAGTTQSVAAPLLKLKVRRVVVANPLWPYVSWHVRGGGRELGTIGHDMKEISIDLPTDVSSVTVVPDAPKAEGIRLRRGGELRPEYSEASIDVSDVGHGSITRKDFPLRPLPGSRVANVQTMGFGGVDNWFWTQPGPMLDKSPEVVAKEYEILKETVASKLPENPEKADHPSDWLRSAKAMRLLIGERYREQVRNDALLISQWRGVFKKCIPMLDVYERTNRREGLMELRQAIEVICKSE